MPRSGKLSSGKCEIATKRENARLTGLFFVCRGLGKHELESNPPIGVPARDGATEVKLRAPVRQRAALRCRLAAGYRENAASTDRRRDSGIR